MKTLFYIFVPIIIASSQVAFAQDTIIKHNGDELSVKVVEIQSDLISYRNMNEEEGKLYTLPKQDVFMIRYADSTKVMFNPSETDIPDITDPDRSEKLYFMGTRDADLTYKGNGAMWGTFGATIIFAPAGLVTGIVAGAVPPKIEKTAPDYELLNEVEYREGYTKKAKKRKWGKAAAGFSLGLLTNILVFSLLSSAN